MFSQAKQLMWHREVVNDVFRQFVNGRVPCPFAKPYIRINASSCRHPSLRTSYAPVNSTERYCDLNTIDGLRKDSACLITCYRLRKNYNTIDDNSDDGSDISHWVEKTFCD